MASAKTKQNGGALAEFFRVFVPEKLTDEFEVLSGKYEVVVTEAKFETVKFKSGDEVERYSIVNRVTEVLEGNGSPNRLIRMRFKADEDGVTKLLNNVFTAGLLPYLKYRTEDELKASLGKLKDKTAYVKAWGWTPDETQEGKPIAEEERKTLQMSKYYDPEAKAEAKGKGKAKRLF